ncbi:MAG: trypsin-like peptidase domain-containing protein [Pirellulales bacterium]|nr:trypsin-like peptidase domain-containing protein [Pirellulales bacterium]
MGLAHLAAAILLVSSPGDTVLLDFGADWCGHCVRMDPLVKQLAAEGYPVRQLDVDEPKNKALADQLRVDGFPTFVMIVGGREVDRQVGACSRQRLVEMLDKAGADLTAKAVRGQSPEAKAPLQAVPFPSGGVADSLTGSNGHRGPYEHPDDRPTAKLAPVASPGGSYDHLVRATVRLQIEDDRGNSRGSGTIIDAREGEALILTCGHVFRDAAKNGKITVDFFGPGAPQAVPGRLVGYDLKSDIGLLSVQTNYPMMVAHLAPASLQLKHGDKVISVGCDGGADATARETQVTSINRYREPKSNIQVAFQPVQGRSGGGLFTPEGWVVGVCNAADPQDNEGLFAGLPVIQEELDKANLAFVYRDMPAGTHGVADGRLQASLGRRHAANNRRQAEAPPWNGPIGTSIEIDHSAARDVANTAQPNDVRLSADERAALEMLQVKSQDAEVVCIIRPRGIPDAKSEIIVLDRASPEFIRQLSSGRESRSQQRLTSLDSPAAQSCRPSEAASAGF